MDAIAYAIAHLPNGPCSPRFQFGVDIISIGVYDTKSKSWPTRAAVSCYLKEPLPTYLDLGERSFRLDRDPKGTLRAHYLEEEKKVKEEDNVRPADKQ